MIATTFDFPADDEGEQPPDPLAQRLLDLLDKTNYITAQELAKDKELEQLYHAGSGEGDQNDLLQESARRKAVDILLYALSLFYGSGGTHQQLVKVLGQKLHQCGASVPKS